MGARSSRRAPPRDEGTAFRRPSPSCQAHRDRAVLRDAGRRAQEARTRSDPQRKAARACERRRDSRASEAQASKPAKKKQKCVSQALPSEHRQAKERTAIPSEEVKRGRGRAAAALLPAEPVARSLSRARANLARRGDGLHDISGARGISVRSKGFGGGGRLPATVASGIRVAFGGHPCNLCGPQGPPPKRWSWGASAWQRAQRARRPRSSTCPSGATTMNSQSPPAGS